MRIRVKHINIVYKTLADGSVKTYHYNRKTGSRIHGEAGTPEFSKSYLESWKSEPAFEDNLSGLIDEYKRSPAFTKLANATRTSYKMNLDAVDEKFGSANLDVLSDGRIRGQFTRWHEGIARSSPRQADYRLSLLKIVLQFGYDRGKLPANHAQGIANIYKSDRAKIIWEPGEIESFCNVSPIHISFAIQFARLTGLRRTDIVTIDLNADHGDHLAWFTSKSGKRVEAVIPVVADLRRLLETIQAYRIEKGVTATTILFNHKGLPWTPMAFSKAFDLYRAKAFPKHRNQAGASKRIHDFRGTFVLELINAGFDDRDIAETVAWKTRDVASIRRKYVDRAAIVHAAIRRMGKNSR